MLDGNKLPRKPVHLANIVSVALVGPGRVSKECLRSIFRVRRRALRRALKWLKKNNRKYYGNIVISEDNLEDYPEDDVPIEIMAVVRHCTDAGVVEQENGGYVPSHEEDMETDSGEW